MKNMVLLFLLLLAFDTGMRLFNPNERIIIIEDPSVCGEQLDEKRI